MPGGWCVSVHMWFSQNISVTFKTYKNRFLHKKRHLIGRVGCMTRKTRASRNRRVDILLGEHALVMAVVADSGLVGHEELCSVR